MNKARMIGFAVLVAGAAARGQEPAFDAGRDETDVRRGEEAGIQARKIGPEEAAARDEFVRARGEFAEVTAAALTSEELTDWARGMSARVRLRRTEEQLWETRARLEAIELSGQSETEEARQLAEQAAMLETDIERLRNPATPDGTSPGHHGLPNRETVRLWVRKEMAEETTRLAETLTTSELERRTKRLGRLVRLARVADGLRRRQGPARVEVEVPAGVIPAGGTASSEEQSLGDSTKVPPTLDDMPAGEGPSSSEPEGEGRSPESE